MRRATFLLVLAALCVPVWADSDLTRLEIKVVDDRGKPIDRANVRVVFKQGRRKLTLTKIRRSWELKTSQEGYARIPAIPKGDIMIQVTAKNHQSFGDTFTIEEDERLIRVELKPPQAPFSVHGPNDPRPKQQ